MIGTRALTRWLFPAAIAALLLAATPLQASGSGPSFTWTQTRAIGLDGVPFEVIRARGGLLAVGYVPSGDRIRASTWTSRDAIHWRRVDPGIEGIAVLRSVVAWHGLFVAVGSKWVGDGLTGQRHGLVAVSRDGHRWHDVLPPSAADSNLQAVSVFRGQFVAAGCANAGEASCLFAQDSRAAIWLSRDGTRWRRQLLANGDHAYAQTVATSAGQLLVGGGYTSVFVDDEGFLVSEAVQAGLWSGSTITGLTQRLHPDVDWAASVEDFVRLRNRAVAVGGQFGCGQAWSSRVHRDQWVEMEDPSTTCGEDVLNSEIDAATVFAGQAYATGFSEEENEASLAVLASIDGRHWRRLDAPAFHQKGVFLEGLDIVGWSGRLIVVGTRSSGTGDLESRVWIGVPIT